MRQIKITQQITNRDTPSVERYLSEIAKIDMITAEEEAELARRYREHKDEQALNKLVRANLRFVVSVAKQYQGYGMSLLDLIGEGNSGLIEAGKKFDETKGFKFISYAVWWIRQSILSAINKNSKMIRLPANKVNDYNKIKKAEEKFVQHHDRLPTPEELGELAELKDNEVTMLKHMTQNSLSLDAPVGGDKDDLNLRDCVEDKQMDSTDTNLMHESLRDDIAYLLKALSEKEQEVLKQYYAIGYEWERTTDEIADNLNISRERVRQIRLKALQKLQSKFRRREMMNYL